MIEDVPALRADRQILNPSQVVHDEVDAVPTSRPNLQVVDALAEVGDTPAIRVVRYLGVHVLQAVNLHPPALLQDRARVGANVARVLVARTLDEPHVDVMQFASDGFAVDWVWQHTLVEDVQLIVVAGVEDYHCVY